MSDQEAGIVLRTGDSAEVTLPIAGIGSRSYAYLIDWHIRVLVVLVWILLMVLIAPAGGWVEGAPGGVLVAVVAIPTVFYLLYHPVLEIAMKGRTPGKKMAGVRLVNNRGQPPSVGALLIRNVFRLIDSQPGFYVIGLLVAFFSRRSLRIGDLAAGTVLVFEQKSDAEDLARAEALLDRKGLTPRQQELVLDLLERWDSLDRPVRRRIAVQLLRKLDPASRDGSHDDERTLRRRLQSLIGDVAHA